MNTLRFMPEGWNNEITKLDINNVNQYIQTGDTLQGLVKECDEKYNLHVKFENGLTGIMPREEIEAIHDCAVNNLGLSLFPVYYFMLNLIEPDL